MGFQTSLRFVKKLLRIVCFLEILDYLVMRVEDERFHLPFKMTRRETEARAGETIQLVEYLPQTRPHMQKYIMIVEEVETGRSTRLPCQTP